MHTYRIDSLGKTWCGGVRNSCILPMNLQSRRNRIRRRRTANGVSGGSALQLWDKPLSFGFRRSPGLTIKCRDVPNGVQRDQELQDRSCRELIPPDPAIESDVPRRRSVYPVPLRRRRYPLHAASNLPLVILRG